MRHYKIFFLLFLIILLTTSLIPNVIAFFPNSHFEVTRRSLLTEQDTELYKSCKKFPNLCYAANMLADVSVFYYYSDFQKYVATHTPSFCRQLIGSSNGDAEMACAVGACAHQAGADIISHEQMVPRSILAMALPNVIIHPFAEQKLDLYVERTNPEVDYDSLASVEDYMTCKPLFMRVLANTDVFFGENMNDKMDKFISEIERDSGKTGYDGSFKNVFVIPTGILVIYLGVLSLLIVLAVLLWLKRLRFKERRTILNIITFIVALLIILLMSYIFYSNYQGRVFEAFTSVIAKPLSKYIPIGNEKILIDDAVERTNKFFREGESSIFNTDASGEKPLHDADEAIKSKGYIIFFIVASLVTFILYRNFRESSPKKGRDVNLGGL